MRVILIALILALGSVQSGQGQFTQTAQRVYEEAQTVYLGNLARRANGVPPLRWNWPLTQAARWFSWDSVVNRLEYYCGHQDTQGGWPSDRTRFWGYKGFSGAENAFCGYVTPQQAIDGWMNSPGHRENLLDPNSREVGLGYYVRPDDGRGYVTQDFGVDAVFPPVIIENEAIQTTTSQVNLYIYDRSSGGGFSEMDPATEMMVSNNRCFDGAGWEPYRTEKPWTLEAGQGWRQVYVRTRDLLKRTSSVNDTIYLGANLPIDELGQAQMSANQSTVTLYNLYHSVLPQVQLSLSWRVDNTYETFDPLWGNGETVNDPEALGGTVYRMFDGQGESSAWVWTTEFVKDTPMVAYVRLKVSNNSSTGEVARITAVPGETRSLRGVDFHAANQYQEFPIAFNFPSADTFLTFQFWRSGAADVYVDAITLFTAPQPVASPLTWQVPGGNFRGQGIWLRYTDGAGQFSALEEANPNPQALGASPDSLQFIAGLIGEPPPPRMIQVQSLGCTPIAWNASADVDWLDLQATGDTLSVSVDYRHLGLGGYNGAITIQPSAAGNGPPVRIPVALQVVAQWLNLRLPLIFRSY